MTTQQHEEITRAMTSQGPYGTGVVPNPFVHRIKERQRRHQQAAIRKLLTDKIDAIFEPRFITAPETSEFIEALVTMTDSRKILEIGTCTGFTTLHIARAICGKPGAYVLAIDARPAHDQNFWNKPELKEFMRFLEGWTPEVFSQIKDVFDLVFVDSDHSIEHTQKELEALWSLTRVGSIFLFHDVPAWQTPENKNPPPIRNWLLSHSRLQGFCLPSCEQLDCVETWGAGYPNECNPGLGVFVRKT